MPPPAAPNHVWTDFGNTGLGDHLLSITLAICPDVGEMPASPSVNHLRYEVSDPKEKKKDPMLPTKEPCVS